MDASDLKSDWINLAQKYSDDIWLIKNLIFSLEKQYTNAHRYYHSLEHIQTLLTSVKEYEMELEDADVVRFAVSDLQFFLDFDLAILGAKWEKYQQYTSQIRQEYKIFPDFMYKAGRAKILQKFLNLPYIYRTSTFRSSLETQAKENIQRELILLS